MPKQIEVSLEDVESVHYRSYSASDLVSRVVEEYPRRKMRRPAFYTNIPKNRPLRP